MGTYLNPGKRSFEMGVNSKIYVDKTKMISHLNSVANTQQRYVSVSRPRRFGKTMAADMVCAYYDRTANSRELFKKTALATCAPLQVGACSPAWDEYLGSFDVIRLVMTKFFKYGRPVSDALDRMQRLVIRDIKRAYPNEDYFDESDLIQTIEDVYSANHGQLVVVIDEWDAIFRSAKTTELAKRSTWISFAIL